MTKRTDSRSLEERWDLTVAAFEQSAWAPASFGSWMPGIFVRSTRLFLAGDVAIVSLINGQAQRDHTCGWSSKMRAPILGVYVQYQRWEGTDPAFPHTNRVPLRVTFEAPDGLADRPPTDPDVRAFALDWLRAAYPATAVGPGSGGLSRRAL